MGHPISPMPSAGEISPNGCSDYPLASKCEHFGTWHVVNEGIALLNAVQDVYLDQQITIA